MTTVYQGQTFATTEQITNTKLHNLVANASISSINPADMSTDFLSSLASLHGKIPMQNFWRHSNVVTNSSVPDVSAYTSLTLNWSTYGSIASLTNMRSGQQFSLVAGQASFPAILDAGSFLLSANWIPAKAGDSLTLLWDGTSFVELGRTSI